jgi:folate-dependent phosphoribosylglycinamide formyltransferase PurN
MRVGILARPQVVEWQRQALSNVAALDGVTITDVVVDASLRNGDSTMATGSEVINQDAVVSLSDVRLFLDVLREDGLKACLYADEKLGWLLFDERVTRDYLRSVPVETVDSVSDATVHECVPRTDGAWKLLPDDVADEVGASCDVVVRFGFGLLKGRILETPTHGVISAHASDIRTYRGMGPRLTFLNDDDEVAVTLQQLTEDIDGGRIVHVSTEPLPPHPTLADVYGRVYALQTTIFARGIDRLRDPGFDVTEPDSLGPYHPHRRLERDPRLVGKLLVKNNVRRLRGLVTD